MDLETAKAAREAQAAARDGQGRFQPGRSGNPAGKKPGTVGLATRLRQALGTDEEYRLVRVVIEAGLAGDLKAAMFVLRQIEPPMRSRPVPLDIPPDADAVTFVNAIKAGMILGEIGPGEANTALTVYGRGQRMVSAQAEMAHKAAAVLQKSCKPMGGFRTPPRPTGAPRRDVRRGPVDGMPVPGDAGLQTACKPHPAATA